MKNYFLLLALAVTFSVSSCSKDDDSNNPDPINQNDPANDPAAIQLSTQLLTDHEWKLTGLTQNVPGQTIYNDIYNNSFPACQRDDVYTFAAAKTIKVAINLAPCSASDADKAGTWNLKNAKTLTITVPDLTQAGLTGEFEIFLLDNSKMILKQTFNGSEYIATFDKNTAVTNTQMLTARPWKISGLMQVDTYNGTTTTTDQYAQLDPCSKDNFVVFQSNGSGNSNEGVTKCDPTDLQSTPFTWAFSGNETKLDVTEMGVSNTYDIVSLSPTTLALRTTYNYQGATSVLTTTFTAQ